MELYTREGNAWVQLAQRGPTGVPTVTVHSEGDLALEAPWGEVRLTAKRYLAHVAEDHATRVGGTYTVTSTGAFTVETGARLGLKAGGDFVTLAGGAIRAHAGGAHTLTGAKVTQNPPGASAPAVAARVPAAGPSAWGPRPVPALGPGRSTEDPVTPTQKELAAKAQKASLSSMVGRSTSDVVDPHWAIVDTTVVPAPGIEGGTQPNPKLTPEQNKLHDIKALLHKSATGKQALAFLDQHKVPATFKAGGGSYWNGKTIVIDQAQSTEEAALTLVHEVNHARATLTGTSGDAHTQSKADYLKTMINEESVGTVASIQAKHELISAGEKVAAVFPLEKQYGAAYAAAYTAAKKANPHVSPHQAGQAGQAAGLQRVIHGFEQGEVVASTTKQPYPAMYGGYWDAVNASKGKYGP